MTVGTPATGSTWVWTSRASARLPRGQGNEKEKNGLAGGWATGAGAVAGRGARWKTGATAATIKNTTSTSAMIRARTTTRLAGTAALPCVP